MNVRQFSLGDLDDILIQPEPKQSPNVEDESDYDDEFEDDFEAEESNSQSQQTGEGDDQVESLPMTPTDGKSGLDHHRSMTSFDVSRSEDSAAYFQEESISVSGSDDAASAGDAKTSPDQLGKASTPSQLEEEEQVNARQTVFGRVKFFDQDTSLLSPPKEQQQKGIDEMETVSSVLSGRDIDAHTKTAASLPDKQVEIHLPSDANKNIHPTPVVRVPSATSSSGNPVNMPTRPKASKADTGDAGIPVGPAVTQQASGVVPVKSSSTSFVKGPVRVAPPSVSAIKRVQSFEVPGIASGASRQEAIQAANAFTSTGGASNEEKQKVVMTVLELLQRAANKADAIHAADLAAKSPTCIRLKSAEIGGVSRQQALQASGKFFMGRVQDYDPDFDAALPFLAQADKERVQELVEKAADQKGKHEQEMALARQELSELKALRAQMMTSSATNMHDMSSKMESTPTSTAGSFANVDMQRGADSVNKSYPSSGAGAAKENRANRTYPESRPISNSKYRGSSASPFETPDSTGSGLKSSGRNFNNSSPADTFDATDRMMMNSSGSVGPQAMKMATAVAETGWGRPLERRADVLAAAKLSRQEADSLKDGAGTLYATFLSDLINCCRNRANECQTTEELAMLKALSDHVSAVFAAGDRMEDIQCKMLHAAIEVQDKMGPSKSAEGSSSRGSVYAQRLQNPYRSATSSRGR